MYLLRTKLYPTVNNEQWELKVVRKNLKDFFTLYYFVCIYKTNMYYIYTQPQNQEFPFWERKKNTFWPGGKNKFQLHMKKNGVGFSMDYSPSNVWLCYSFCLQFKQQIF